MLSIANFNSHNGVTVYNSFFELLCYAANGDGIHRHKDGDEVATIVTLVVQEHKGCTLKQNSSLVFYNHDNTKLCTVTVQDDIYTVTGRDVGSILHERTKTSKSSWVFALVLRQFKLNICPKYTTNSKIIKNWISCFADLSNIAQNEFRDISNLQDEKLHLFHILPQSNPGMPNLKLFPFISKYSTKKLILNNAPNFVPVPKRTIITGTTNSILLRSLCVHNTLFGVAHTRKNLIISIVAKFEDSEVNEPNTVLNNIIYQSGKTSFYIHSSTSLAKCISKTAFAIWRKLPSYNAIQYLGMYIVESQQQWDKSYIIVTATQV
jgi:hypothetical protein